jgi:ribosome-associated toxin RatA of RatAB toxin-antitoxin module
MRHFKDSTFVEASPEAVFDVVANVAAWPEFISSCAATTCEQAGPDNQEVTITLRETGFEETIRARNHLRPTEAVEMQLVEGPMKSLDGKWTFVREGDGCRLGLDVKFSFSPRAKEFVFGRPFEKACGRLLAAVAKQAAARQAA